MVSKHSPDSVWTDEAISVLLTKVAEGSSARQIATILGVGFSRASVISKAHRLGLTLVATINVWPDAATDYVRDRAAENWNSRAIAEGLNALGYSYNRKQVSDHARRHDIALAKAAPADGDRHKTRQKPHTSSHQKVIEQRTAKAAVMAQQIVIDDLPIPASRPVKVADLTSKHCRWPINRDADGNRLFCGAHKIDGSSYCIHHFYTSNGMIKERKHQYVAQETA